MSELDVYRQIEKRRPQYQKCVGYIGKLGARLDVDLIDTITEACPDVLFVFVGPYLKDQKNSKLMHILSTRNNILLNCGIPSAYVHSVLDLFDLLMIPHAVGNSENGGDPEKLYHYLTRKRPIITTGILGVDEFKDEIVISNDPTEWIDTIRMINNSLRTDHDTSKIGWKYRFEPILSSIATRLA